MGGQSLAVPYPKLPDGAAVGWRDLDAVRAEIYSTLGKHRQLQVIALRFLDAMNHDAGWTYISLDTVANAVATRKIDVQLAIRSLTGDGIGGDSRCTKLERAIFHREVVKIPGRRAIGFTCAILTVDRAATRCPVDGAASMPQVPRPGSASRNDRAAPRVTTGQRLAAPNVVTSRERSTGSATRFAGATRSAQPDAAKAAKITSVGMPGNSPRYALSCGTSDQRDGFAAWLATRTDVESVSNGVATLRGGTDRAAWLESANAWLASA